MDLSFSTTEEAFRSELRTWLAANKPQHDFDPTTLAEEVAYLVDWQHRLHAGGWVGVHWPRECGGRGATVIENYLFQEEMARAKAPMLINLAGLTMGGPVLIAHGTDEQKRRHLRKILAAEEIWCQGFSEPNAGSDLAALKTRAVLEGDSFVVSGQKVWTSFARYADWCMLLVRTDVEAPKHKGITFLLVDMHSPGVSVRPLKQISGEEDFNEVFFEDVRVPRANIVGELNGGWEIAITTLMHERATLTFTRQLQSRTALTDMLSLARHWQVDGRPATQNRLLRQQLAQALIESDVIKFTAYRSLTKTLRGGIPGPEGSMEKLFWSEMYQRMLDVPLAMQGPYSQLMKGSPHVPDNGQWPHLMLYSRGRTIAAGSSEIQRNIIAERVLRLPRESK